MSLTLVYVPSALPRRCCTAERPMQPQDRHRYQWSHPDAVAVEPFFNLVIYRCPHCTHTFHAPQRT
jgi:hypothetical protein